jgi:hypothetical protein
MYGQDVRIRMGIVTGRGKGENGTPTDPSNSSFYFRDLSDGPGVKNTDLPAVMGNGDVSAPGARKSSNAPSPGTVITYMSNFGERETAIAISSIPSIGTDGASPGNQSLQKTINSISNSELMPPVAAPSKLIEKMKNGAKIREREAPQNFRASMLNGLPQNGSVFPLLGPMDKLPKQISTALDPASSYLSSDALSKLPGSNMNIGDLMSSFSPSQLSGIMGGKSKSLQETISNFASQSQSVSSGDGPGFMSGSRVDPSTFMSSAESLLKNATSISDVMGAFTSLQSNPALQGIDKLAGSSFDVQGAFGSITNMMDGQGNITSVLGDAVQSAMSSFQSLIGGAGLPNAGSGASMFGEGSSLVSEALNRFELGNQGPFKELLEGLSSSGTPGSVGAIDKVANIQDLKGLLG